MGSVPSCRVRALAKVALFTGAALIASPALAQTTQLEEVVVTAQKREQSLQEVPISITALTGAALQANRIVDARDLNAVAPNLTVRIASGGVQQANYSMRGLVTQGAALGSDKGISQYIDGVYLQTSIGSLYELADVERIEVLKGPQGTLFGRNATGGAISIITRNPSGTFGVHQEVTVGNFSKIRTKTRVDLPQTGPLALSFTFVHSEHDGDTKNLGAGTVWDYTAGGQGFRVSPKRLGDEDINSFFAAARIDLMQNLDLIYKFDWTENHFTPEAQGMAFIDSPLVAAIYGSQPNQSLMTPVTNTRPDAVNNWFATPSFAYAYGHNLTARYSFTDELSVKNIFSWRRSGVNATFQLEGLGGLQLTPLMGNLPPPAPPPNGLGLAGQFGPFLIGSPWNLIANTGQQTDTQWSDEIQLNWNSKWANVTAGYIHFDYNTVGGGFEGVPNVLQFLPTPGFVLPARDYRHTEINVKSNAIFAQVEGHVTSRIDLIAGYRLTWDEKNGIDNTVQTPEGASVATPVAYKNARPTWLGGINFRPRDGILTYAKYSTGFISGGNLAGLTYQPEIAKSWEIGIKTDLLDRRLRSNLAVFDVKYSQLQFQTSGLNVIPPIPASVVLVNAGDGKAQGFEWENTYLPIEGLTLSFNVGYTDFKYTTIDPIIGTLDFFRPINRPKWTGTGSIEYHTPELYAGGHVVFRLDANFRSKTILGITTPQINNPAAVAAVTTGDSFIVNGRLAFADWNLAGGKAQAALWARNLLDNKDLANDSTFILGPIGNIYPGSYERARTFGVDLIIDF